MTGAGIVILFVIVWVFPALFIAQADIEGTRKLNKEEDEKNPASNVYEQTIRDQERNFNEHLYIRFAMATGLYFTIRRVIDTLIELNKRRNERKTIEVNRKSEGSSKDA